ncbi:AI-2E family transporter [Clostridium paraputrificum]|uniref:AI-2E family transporter n=1 Tax=Clostridium TaxID=1485 RepID=UPI003D34E10F
MGRFMNSITQYLSPTLIENTKRIIKFLLIYTIGFMLLVVGLKYAIPFVIALAIAMSLRPLKNRILAINKRFKKFKISEGLVSMLLTVSIVAITSLILFAAGYKIVEQLKNFYDYITNQDTLNIIINDTSIRVNNFLESMENMNPDVMVKVNEVATKVVSVVTSLTATFVQNLLNILVSIPTAFIMVLITIIATFFFTKDIDKIEVKIKHCFSEKGLEVIRRIRKKKNEIFGGYIKAYSLIMIAIFIYSAVIFKIAGLKYAMVIAIITAVLDALPLFGAGLVYGIMAISSFVTGDIKSGVILIVGYIGAVVIRQYLEQILVSSFLGVHPLVIIIALFLVLTPAGFIGMFYFLGAFLLYGVIFPPNNT